MAESAKNPLVSVIMGSASDWDIMSSAVKVLEEFNIPYEARVLSAHRTPDVLREYVKFAEERGVEVFITGAGMAAALPGVVASCTVLPVLGVPVPSGSLNGVDALYSIVQMPPGIPVGCLAIGKPGATNAGLLAVAILSLKRQELREKLIAYREKQAKKVLEANLPESG
ncbi:MAG: 5-(carboxyamino)imidazole ribonucleotide mutase [Candidatus Hydrogenedentes bacterium]|nr:5-(carboxyamino)imidazole ribonucleotide mutase [Candidatus Hydrogenedentota bacterium]